MITFYYPIRLWWSLSSPAFEFVEGVGAVGLSAHCCMGGLRLVAISGTYTPGRHLGQGVVLLLSTILSDYGGVCPRRHLSLWKVLAFPSPCCVGGLRLSLELIRRAVISDEALYYYFLLSYLIMVESVLAGI